MRQSRVVATELLEGTVFSRDGETGLAPCPTCRRDNSPCGFDLI